MRSVSSTYWEWSMTLIPLTMRIPWRLYNDLSDSILVLKLVAIKMYMSGNSGQTLLNFSLTLEKGGGVVVDKGNNIGTSYTCSIPIDDMLNEEKYVENIKQ